MSATVLWNAAAETAACSVTFPADPTAVTLVVTDPAGVVVTYNWPGGPNTLAHGGAGAFSQAVPASSAVPGIWQGVWTGTGAVSDVQAFTFSTMPTSLGQYYCSAEELISRLRITVASDNTEVALAVAAASRAVDGYCERRFYRAAETRTYVPDGLYEVRVDDFVSVSALATDPAGTAAQGGAFPVSWSASDFQPWPFNPIRYGEPWPFTRLRAVGSKVFPWVVPQVLMRQDRVQVTGVFGWPAVPQAVRSAALMTAAEVFRSKDAPGGGQVAGEFAIAVIRANPLISGMLGVYQRNPFLAA